MFNSIKHHLSWFYKLGIRRYGFSIILLLPPANEVWGKLMFSQTCVSHSDHSEGSPYDVTSYVAARLHVPSRVFVQWVSVQGVCVQRGISVQKGSLSRGGGISLRGSVKGDVCLGSLCPGGLCREPPGIRKTCGTHPFGMLSCS